MRRPYLMHISTKTNHQSFETQKKKRYFLVAYLEEKDNFDDHMFLRIEN